MCYTVKSIEDVRRLVVASRGLSALSDGPTLLGRACRRMAELVDADMAAIALYDGADTLVVQAADGPAPAGLRLPRDGGVGWRALDRAMPVTTGDCSADGEPVDDLVAALVPDGIQGLAAVPLTFNGNWLGVLYVGLRGRRVPPRITLLMTEFGASLAPLLLSALRADRAGQIAVAQDRQRIAQQLHDTAGQLLFQISMSAKEIQLCAGTDPDGAVAAARSIEGAAAQASHHLREAMHSLLPAAEALPVTLRRDVAGFAARTGIATEVVTLGTPAHAGSERRPSSSTRCAKACTTSRSTPGPRRCSSRWPTSPTSSLSRSRTTARACPATSPCTRYRAAPPASASPGCCSGWPASVAPCAWVPTTTAARACGCRSRWWSSRDALDDAPRAHRADRR